MHPGYGARPTALRSLVARHALRAAWAQLQALPFEAPFLTEAAAYLGDAADFLRQLFS